MIPEPDSVKSNGIEQKNISFWQDSHRKVCEKAMTNLWKPKMSVSAFMMVFNH